MERYEIAIIGNGPAAVSAAITAKVRNKNILLIAASPMSEKVSKAHKIRNYPGLPDVPGSELAAALENHLKEMDITMTQTQITNVYAMGDYFGLQTPTDMLEAETVILATGVVLGKPLPGENEYLGRGVSYCATCDAFFYRDKDVAVLGYNEESQHEAEFLAETSKTVYYFPMKGSPSFTAPNIQVVSGKPEEIIGDKKAAGVKTSEGVVDAEGVFILRDAISADKLVPGLETDGPHVKVDLQMTTSIPGLFAAGDIAGKPYQYIKAAGQGNIAALSAVEYLDAKKRKAAAE
ncbi:MAG: NAD(P)/FAD-dependent oxidoreductase [Lachnospiraceae bacterium]|nr:NAD(P)/FAD-dependent oxidoreductase [Lachnospiraceae bacterium]